MMRLLRRDFMSLLGISTLPMPVKALALGSAGADISGSIRTEAMDHSQILRTVHVLADVYGHRLTGSPSAKAAGEWAAGRMTDWGLKNAHLEPWHFGYPGWANVECRGSILSPVQEQLYVRPAAWTPGTNGQVAAQVILISPPDPATPDQLAHYLGALSNSVTGKMVMVGAAEPLPLDLDPPTYRINDTTMAEFLKPQPYKPDAPADPKQLTGLQRSQEIDRFLIKAGALVRLRDSQRPMGELHAFANYTYDLTKAPTTVAMRNEDYSRIARLLADGTPVTLSFDIQNRAYPDGRTCFNTIAEIPGSDKADEVVMLGAHLDSWHLATGATDDGIGCAIMMEAVRILMALEVKPRRTIRIALWTGEEQGLYGSQAYVAEHFGTDEDPKPAFFKLAAYINIDGGTGRVRDANVFGPQASASILDAILKRCADIGVMGVIAHGARRLRSTDATTFSRAGLPAIGLLQDPIDNESAWHSNLDTFERVLEPDAKQAAIVVATLLYALAMRDQMLPRFLPSEMPTPMGHAPSATPAELD